MILSAFAGRKGGTSGFLSDKPKVLQQFEKKVYYIGNTPSMAF